MDDILQDAAPARRAKKPPRKEYPITDFTETPTKGNPQKLEPGVWVTLARSQKVLDGEGMVWFAGVRARVLEMHPQDSGVVVAKVQRNDKTLALLYACWLERELTGDD